MKRSECCTVEKLKELGYKAVWSMQSWFNGNIRSDCNEKQAQRVFEVVVETVRDGGKFEIVRNDYNHTVSVFVEDLEWEKAQTKYYLIRQMTEAEQLEADLHTGRGVHWDYVKRG